MFFLFPWFAVVSVIPFPANISYILPTPMTSFSGIFQIIQHRLFGRHKRKVMSTVCSFEVRILSYKWSCNDSCYCMSAHQKFFLLFCNIHTEFLPAQHLHELQSGTHCQRMYIRSTHLLSNMLTPIILDNFCSGIWFITQHFPSCLLSEFIQHILRESVRIYRKWFRRYHTCHLQCPMVVSFPIDFS